MFNKLIYFISRITKIEEQFIKFLFVGFLNTVFGYLIYSFFIFIGFNYPAAIFFGTIIAVLFNFKTIGVLVFNNKKNSLLIKFIFVYTLIYIINILGIKIVVNCITPNLYIAGFILIVPMALLSYYLNKTIVFKKY